MISTGLYFLLGKDTFLMDHLHYRLNFDLNKSSQKFHYKISNIDSPKGYWAVNFPRVIMQND